MWEELLGVCTVYSKTAGIECGKAQVQTDTNFWHKLSGFLSLWLWKPCRTFSSATSMRQPSAGGTLINPSLPACWGESTESHSYSRWLMFYRFYWGGQSSWVICVIAGGKGTIEVGCQSGGGRVQGMRNTVVCVWRLAHAHLKAVWHPYTLTFSVSWIGLQNKHTHLM